jgi:hypothetical protein
VQTLGRRHDANGELQLLVRASNSAGLASEMLTTSLPQASTGLRVNVINDARSVAQISGKHG